MGQRERVSNGVTVVSVPRVVYKMFTFLVTDKRSSSLNILKSVIVPTVRLKT